MKTWNWKAIGAITGGIAVLVAMLTVLVLMYNGLRADMRASQEQTQRAIQDLRVEMQTVNGTLSDVRERLAALELRVELHPDLAEDVSFQPSSNPPALASTAQPAQDEE